MYSAACFRFGCRQIFWFGFEPKFEFETKIWVCQAKTKPNQVQNRTVQFEQFRFVFRFIQFEPKLWVFQIKTPDH